MILFRVSISNGEAISRSVERCFFLRVVDPVTHQDVAAALRVFLNDIIQNRFIVK